MATAPAVRAFRLIAVLPLAVMAASCGSGPKLYPVKGKVLYQDQPAEGATVVFHPKNRPADAPKPSGTVGADGSFTLSTYPHGEGAPPGEYLVLVSWYPPDARTAENPESAKSKLPELYGNAATSPLTATVGTGPTELEPFRLSK